VFRANGRSAIAVYACMADDDTWRPHSVHVLEVSEGAVASRSIQQGMRHTYCSNWLAMHQDVNKLVLQSGHDSAETMWKHYHRGTTKADARKFWAIVPPRESGNIIPMARHA